MKMVVIINGIHICIHTLYSSKKIIPGTTRNVNAFVDAIQSRFHVQPMLNCTHSGTLSDVSLYFYVRGRDNYELTDSPADGTCFGNVKFPKKY